MKKRLIVLLALLILVGCSDKENNNTNNDLNSNETVTDNQNDTVDHTDSLDLSFSIVNKWVSLSNSESYYIFNDDNTYLYYYEGMKETHQGTYEYLEDEKCVRERTDTDDNGNPVYRYMYIINNLLMSIGSDVYVIEGQTPNTENNLEKLSGYYKDTRGWLYSFDEDGIMKYYGENVYDSISYIYDGMTLIGIQDSKLVWMSNWKVNDWGSMEMVAYTGHLAALLKPIDEATFNECVLNKTYENEEQKEFPQLEILADSIKIRIQPSTSALEENKRAKKGEVYDYYEVVENEGYTWYRIGDFGWIADQDGEWIKTLD